MHDNSKRSLSSSLLLSMFLGLGAVFAWLLFGIVLSPMFNQGQPSNLSMEQFIAWLVSLALMSPALASVFLFFILPLVKFEPVLAKFRDENPLLSSIVQSFQMFWPQAAVLLAVSALLAIGCCYRHRRLEDHGAIAWSLFVLFMGLPGLVGYLLHRRWPPMEVCQNCQRQSPRDRDACLHCQTPFPPPAMKGIEIFA